MRMFGKVGLGLAVSLALAGAAQAELSVNSSLFSGNNILSDDSAEILISATGGTTLDVGGRLRGIFNVNTTFSPNTGDSNSFTPNNSNQLAGIFDITVVAKDSTGDCFDGPGGAAANFCWVFAPTLVATSGFDGALYGNAPEGTAIVFFENTAGDHPFTRGIGCGSALPGGTCEQTVTDDSQVLWHAGFNGTLGPTGQTDTGEFWFANATTESPSTIGQGGQDGSYNLGLHVLAGGTTFGRTLGSVDAADCFIANAGLNICGGGGLVGLGSTPPASTDYDNFDNVEFRINVVPEPGSLALLGLGLGLGALALRRKQA